MSGIQGSSIPSGSIGSKASSRQVGGKAIRVNSSAITIRLVVDEISTRNKHVSLIVNRTSLDRGILYKIRVLQSEETVGFDPNGPASRVVLVERIRRRKAATVPYNGRCVYGPRKCHGL